jgi:hypothetical protein
MKKSESIKVVTGLVRFLNVHVHIPHAVIGKQKYSITLLVAKSEKETIAGIQKAYTTLKDMNQEQFKSPIFKIDGLRDGDVEKGNEVYRGCYFLNATSLEKPGIVDIDLNPLLDEGSLYSGCYGRASITLYLYQINGKAGIAAGLNNLQKLKDGEKIVESSSQTDFI